MKRSQVCLCLPSFWKGFRTDPWLNCESEDVVWTLFCTNKNMESLVHEGQFMNQHLNNLKNTNVTHLGECILYIVTLPKTICNGLGLEALVWIFRGSRDQSGCLLGLASNLRLQQLLAFLDTTFSHPHPSTHTYTHPKHTQKHSLSQILKVLLCSIVKIMIGRSQIRASFSLGFRM